MNLSAHAFAEGGVDHSVASQWQFAGKERADDGGFEVDAIGAFDVDPGTGKASFDELANEICVHVGGEVRQDACRKLGTSLYPQGSP